VSGKHARESGDRSQVVWSHLHLAFVRLHQANYDDAHDLFVRCLQEWDGSINLGHCSSYAAQGLACTAASLGQAEHAMRLFGAAEAIDRVRWRPAGLENSFGFATPFSIPHWKVLASRALGENAAAEALSAGRAMSVTDAMAYALKPRVESVRFRSYGVRESALTPREREVAAFLPAAGQTVRLPTRSLLP
jgi:hypothetical protein